MNTPSSTRFQSLRPVVRDLPESGILEIVNAGRTKEGLIPLWAGEGHLPTPEFICTAANEALAAGHTFYTWQRGIPELREALADYHQRVYGRRFSSQNFFVTGSGMQAVQLTLQAIAGEGDEIILPTPAWPNLAAAATILGAKSVEVPQTLQADGWKLELADVKAAITNKTKAIFINSPSNPTGWTATCQELKEILDLAREYGLWIIADEVYGKFYFEADRAPSFYDVMEEGDRIIFNNTFSKNWAMTGWRVGWISAPEELGQVFENLIQFSTSGVAGFMQYGAAEALNAGDDFLAQQVAMARKSRDLVCDALGQNKHLRFAIPEGAFYLFFRVDGMDDTRALALRLVDEANVGLAPGSAFGEAGSGYLRLCFARDPKHVQIASDRLANWFSQNI